MTPQIIGFLSIGFLFVSLIFGAPIGLAMILAGFGGFAMIVGISPALSVLETAAFETASNYSFTLLPLFLLMGALMSASGVARDLFEGARRLTRGWSGGLAAAGVVASGVFSTVSGSSLATASTMTRVAYPEMEKRGYDPRLATGSLAAGGTLGILIPPSIALLLYGLITEQSVGEMFLAGILPGILALALYLVAIVITSKFWPGTPDPAPEPTDDRGDDKGALTTLKLFAPALVLFGLVMGGLYGGFFTPSEAGGAGAGLALIFAIARGMRWTGFKAAVIETVKTTGAIFLILIGAEVFSFVLSTSQITFAMVDFIQEHDFAPWQVMANLIAFYVVLGCFMESLAMILLTVPIFFPVIMAAGFDPVWFGVIAVVTVELGLITPPVGMNLFMVKGAARHLPTRTIMVGVLPFVLIDIVRLGILLAVPALSLLLPGRL